jgi:hypothetical protein
VADQVDVADGLDTHHSGHHAIDFVADEGDPCCDIGSKLGCRHVGLVPAIRRNRAAISFGCRIDDREHRFRFILAAKADRRLRSSGARIAFGYLGRVHRSNLLHHRARAYWKAWRERASTARTSWNAHGRIAKEPRSMS